jgi:hypothetical protein
MLRDSKTKELRSAIPVIEEGKGEGKPLDNTGLNTILHDNVLVEFNTKPAKSLEEFIATIGTVLREGQKVVAAKGLELHLLTSADFPKQELEHPEARIFGCEPDFDAYELVMNEVPASAALKPFRSTGGHLHIGKHEKDEKLRALLDDPYGKVRVVKALDAVVGIPSVFLDRDPTAPPRRKLYGKAGCHRPTDYGVEWRACGPWWLASPDHTELVWRLTHDALALAVDEERFLSIVDKLGGEEAIIDTINNSKATQARKLFGRVLAHQIDVVTCATVKALDDTFPNTFQKAWGL